MFVVKIKNIKRAFVKDWTGKTYDHLLKTLTYESDLLTYDLQEAKLFKTKAAARTSLRFHWGSTTRTPQKDWWIPYDFEVVEVDVIVKLKEQK